MDRNDLGVTMFLDPICPLPSWSISYIVHLCPLLSILITSSLVQGTKDSLCALPESHPGTSSMFSLKLSPSIHPDSSASQL